MDTPTPTPAPSQDLVLAELRRLNHRVEELSRQLETSTRGLRTMNELVEEATPISREMMNVGIQKLGDLDQRGYLRFGRALADVADRVVTHYSEDDVRELAESVVNILDTVRAVTRPEVLALAADAAEVVEHPEGVKPAGVWDMLRAGSDAEVQRGLGVMLEVLRHVGRAADASRTPARPKTDPRVARLGARRLPPKAAPARPAAPAPRAAAPAAAPASAAAPRPAAPAEGLPAEWTRAWAEATAASLGVPLTDGHWAVIDFARNEYTSTGVSPNLRRISAGTGLAQRDIYALFPKAPGRTAARIAGIPKPAGCL